MRISSTSTTSSASLSAASARASSAHAASGSFHELLGSTAHEERWKGAAGGMDQRDGDASDQNAHLNAESNQASPDAQVSQGATGSRGDLAGTDHATTALDRSWPGMPHAQLNATASGASTAAESAAETSSGAGAAGKAHATPSAPKQDLSTLSDSTAAMIPALPVLPQTRPASAASPVDAANDGSDSIGRDAAAAVSKQPVGDDTPAETDSTKAKPAQAAGTATADARQSDEASAVEVKGGFQAELEALNAATSSASLPMDGSAIASVAAAAAGVNAIVGAGVGKTLAETANGATSANVSNGSVASPSINSQHAMIQSKPGMAANGSDAVTATSRGTQPNAQATGQQSGQAAGGPQGSGQQGSSLATSNASPSNAGAGQATVAQAVATQITPSPAHATGNAATSAGSTAAETANAHAAGAEARDLATTSGQGDAVASSGSLAPGASSINTARVLQSMGESEMRVGLHSAEFGDISIRTAMGERQMTAQISLDHGDLSQALNAHAGAAQTKLDGDLGMRTSIQIHNLGSTFNGQQSHSGAAGHGQREQGSVVNPGRMANLQSSTSEVVVPAAVITTTASSSRLSIQA